jgi:hypothetical protein
MQRSTASTTEPPLGWAQTAWLVGAAALAAGAYLLAAYRAGQLGFPLDDSWIHLTYARNLAEHGQWAFMLGQPSAGSTAPLWTFLLATGFLLRLGPYAWTYALGICGLIGIGMVSEIIVRRKVPGYRPAVPWIGLLMVTEWHFVWAAVSGMETLLFLLLTLLILGMLLIGSSRYLAQGILVGLAVWVRPDALTLLVPAGAAALLAEGSKRERARAVLLLSLGLLLLLTPYIAMNLALSATPFPNTLYAKLAEYAAWRASAITIKLENFSLIFFAGISLVLFPAAVGAVVQGVRTHGWRTLLVLGWAAGYAWLFTSRLPVYQNGRYLMPATGVYILVALIFLASWLPTVRSHALRLVRFAWLASLVILATVTYLYGMSNYASNVELIDSEMVACARWVAAALPQGELVAAHDIGALGYFAPKVRLIDLAGLISPEVVPIITDEQRLAEYIRAMDAPYVILVPRHYPALAQMGRPVFIAKDPADPSFDSAMVIYEWKDH